MDKDVEEMKAAIRLVHRYFKAVGSEYRQSAKEMLGPVVVEGEHLDVLADEAGDAVLAVIEKIGE